MSEVENEVDVVVDAEAEASKAKAKHEAEIRQMLDDMAAGNAKEVQDRFNDLLGAKINADLEQRKQEMSQNIFNNPDMQAMGLADGEENILDTEPAEMGTEWVADESEEESEETSGEENEDV